MDRRSARAGIGAGIATVMAQQGARVGILDLDGATAAETAAGLAVPGIGMACDVIIEDQLQAAVKEIVAVARRLQANDVVPQQAFEYV